MTPSEIHLDIVKRKTVEELTDSFASFETLLGMVMLFSSESDLLPYSGFVTAALLDWEGAETILCLNGKYGMNTMKLSREELKTTLLACEAFVGKTPDESFLIQS